jgi:NAD(P)-dependent dehydrogenase (short-subunit alcohol dehydrogenase family)
MAGRLQGKHAVLTGAGGGIGLAVTQAYLAQGAVCTVADMGKNAPAELTDAIAAGRVNYVQVDVTQMAQIDALLDAAEKRFGDIHVLYNNAAIFDMAPLLESTEASYDKVFSVNVKGMFFVMQKTLARMVAKGTKNAAVINMSSQAGRRGEALVSHYCASKAAVISYTQSAALAMAPYKIRVNSISPGVVDTPMWAGVDAMFAKFENLPIGEKKRRVGLAVPLGYMGSPDDIAGAAVFLASDEASYITAQTLNVDGGAVMS